jgi:hypothetical protein
MLRFFSPPKTARPDYRKLFQEELKHQKEIISNKYAIVKVIIIEGQLNFSIFSIEENDSDAKMICETLRFHRDYLEDYYYTNYDKNLIKRIENQK